MVSRTVAARTGCSSRMPSRVGGGPLRSSWISSARTVKAAPPVSISTSTAPSPSPIRNCPGAGWLHLPNVISAVSNVSGWASCTWSSTSNQPAASSRKPEGPREFLQALHGVGRAQIEGQGVGLVGQFGPQHAGGGLAARPLQLAGDPRHRMAERVEHLALVAPAAEGAGRVDLGAGIDQRRVAAQGHDERAHVVVVVVLGVVPALEGRRRAVARRRRPADQDARLGEPVAQRRPGALRRRTAGREAELGKPYRPNSNRLPLGPLDGQQAPLFDGPSSPSRSGGSGRPCSTASGSVPHAAIGEGRIDARQDLHAPPEPGDLRGPAGRPVRSILPPVACCSVSASIT